MCVRSFHAGRDIHRKKKGLRRHSASLPTSLCLIEYNLKNILIAVDLFDMQLTHFERCTV